MNQPLGNFRKVLLYRDSKNLSLCWKANVRWTLEFKSRVTKPIPTCRRACPPGLAGSIGTGPLFSRPGGQDLAQLWTGL